MCPHSRAVGLLLILLLPRIAGAATDPVAPAGGEAFLRRGLELQKEGKFPEALENLRKAVRLRPDAGEAHFRFGSLLGRMGYLAESRFHLREAVRLDPHRPEIHSALATVLEELFRHEEALEAYQAVLGLDPPKRQEYIALVGIGKVYERMGDLERAETSYGKILEENPRSPATLAHSGILLKKKGDLPGAIRRWQQYLRLRPENPLVKSWVRDAREILAELRTVRGELEETGGGDVSRWVSLGDLLLDARDGEGALEAFQEAIRRGAGPEIRLRRSEVLQDQGRWAEADRELRRALKGNPEDRRTLYRLALGRRWTGDCGGEREAWRRLTEVERANPYPFRKALEAVGCGHGDPERTRKGLDREARSLLEDLGESPDDPVVWFRLALVRKSQGKIPEMFQAIQRSLRAAPNDSFVLRELRRISTDHPLEVNRFAERIREELKNSPRDPVDILFLGYLLWLGGDSESGLKAYRAAVKIYPERPSVHVALGNALLLLEGTMDEALSELRRAAELGPDYAPAFQALGVLELENRSPEAAGAAARRLLSLRPDSYHGFGLLGSAQEASGDHEGAVRSFRAALRADPTDPEGTVRFQLAISLTALGQWRQARRVLVSSLPWMPEEMYRQVWELVREYFVERSFAGQDWDLWRRRFDGRMPTRQAAYRAVAEMLSSLGNRYTRIRRPEETIMVFLSRRSGDLELDPKGRPLPTSRTVLTEDLSSGIRYIRLTNFSDPRLTEEIRQALRSREGGKGIILDLRGNPGGVQWDSEVVGSLFLGAGTPLGMVVDRRGSRQVKAGGEEPIDPDIPVVVLVDENTGSAAESLAGALRGAGRAKVVGQPTRGKGSAQVSLLLPGGAMVLVTAARNVAPGGVEIEGVGIRPDFEITGGDRKPVEEDPWIRKAREILTEDKTDPPEGE